MAPSNAEAQRDLSISYQRLGEMAVSAGELERASVWFQRSLDITKKLSEADPSNAQTQIDVLLTRGGLLLVAAQTNDLPTAREHIQAGMRIIKHLDAKRAFSAHAQYQQVRQLFMRLAAELPNPGGVDGTPGK
jgi:Tfp pilus assembly protein PilF